MKKVRSWTLYSFLLVFVCLNCMPYVSKGRRGKLVRVAIECGVDRVYVSGTHQNKSVSNQLITQAGHFPVFLGPRDGRVTVNGRDYRGSLEIRKLDGNLWVLNVLDLESYIKGVVPCEIGGITEREFEAARAQAVAARTYAYAHIGQYSELGFDLYSTVQDQVYQGISCERPLTNKAVESTAGEVLFYRNEPIEAKYHSTCGGRTADFSDAWAGSAPPYLSSVVCRYCANSPHYEWKKTMDRNDFFAHIRDRLARAKIALETGELIHSFRITRNRRSHRIKELILITNRREYAIPNYRIRTLFGQPGDPGGLLKSNYVYIRTKGERVIIEGRGFGHGVGMCQFGAIEMAKQGRNYRQILYHYYKGARIRKTR